MRNRMFLLQQKITRKIASCHDHSLLEGLLILCNLSRISDTKCTRRELIVYYRATFFFEYHFEYVFPPQLRL